MHGLESHISAIHLIPGKYINLLSRQVAYAVFGYLIENKRTGKEHGLMVAHYELNVRLIHEPFQSLYPAVTVPVNNISQYVQKVIPAETCCFKQLKKSVMKISVKV